MEPGLPFSHLNLRYNPFGELTPEERAEVAVVDIERFVHRMEAGRFAVQFQAPCGRGKTTHLLALRTRFPEAPYVHVLENGRSNLPVAPVVFVDDLDHLPPRLRLRFLKRESAVAVTTHVDLSADFAKAGLDHETVAVGNATPALLSAIIRRRVERARRGPGELPDVPAEEVCKLIERFGDDLRAAEDHLYDRFQEMKEIGHVQV